MIAIVNIGGGDPDDLGGWRHYEVRINKQVICRFRHKRSDGLAVCLRKAADSVDEHQLQEQREFMDALLKICTLKTVDLNDNHAGGE